MTARSLFQVQILEKLGAPLLLAVSEVIAREKKDAQDSQKQEAEQVAALLNKAVQASVGLAASMDLKDSEQQADAVRLALAGVIGSLVAGQYRVSGKVPGDADVTKLVKALEAVLTFSDNFAPAAENTARLESIGPDMLIADESQIGIQLIFSLVPVVNAVAHFPFGRPENKLVQEVSDQLQKKAKTISESVLTGASEQVSSRAELKVLESLALIYAECHKEETARIMAMNDADRTALAESSGGSLPMERVWQSFDLRSGMAQVIGKSAGPASSSAGAGQNAPVGAEPQASPEPPPVQAPQQQEAPPVQAPPPQEPPVAEQQAAPPVMPPAPPTEQPAGDGQQDQGGAYNPMGFFKPGTNKPNENDDGEQV